MCAWGCEASRLDSSPSFNHLSWLPSFLQSINRLFLASCPLSLHHLPQSLPPRLLLFLPSIVLLFPSFLLSFLPGSTPWRPLRLHHNAHITSETISSLRCPSFLPPFNSVLLSFLRSFLPSVPSIPSLPFPPSSLAFHSVSFLVLLPSFLPSFEGVTAKLGRLCSRATSLTWVMRRSGSWMPAQARCVCVCVCMIYIYIIYTYIYMYIYVCIYIYNKYIYIKIYIHTHSIFVMYMHRHRHTHTHIYIYIYIYLLSLPLSFLFYQRG